MLKLYQHDLTPAQYAAGQGVICTLPKAIAPEVPLTINGDWSLSFAYPVGSLAADELQLDRLVEADGQLYRIEDVEKIGSADGLRLQIHAVHLVYDLRRKHIVNIETAETTPGGISQPIALDQILHGTSFTRGTVDTDIVLDYLDILQKDAMWALKEQVLPLWGGELQPDNWTVNIRKKMGADRGAQLRYGKNIDGVRLKESLDGTITRLHILGYKNANIEPINSGLDYIDSPNIGLYAQPIEGLVTFPDDDLPEDLLSKGQEYLATVDTPRISMTVDLAKVRGSVQYRHYKDLERVELGDTVTVYHQRLKIDITARIQARTYNPVTGENIRVVLGNDDRNLYSHIASLQQAAEIIKMIADRKGHIRGERLRGIIDLLTTKLYASGAYTTAQVLEDKGVLLENTDEASVDYGALYAGPGIFAIASEKDNTGQWIWRTFGTGQGFVGYEIIAHTITANKLASDVGQQLDLSSNEAITQLVEDYNAQEQRLQTAEQKITPAAITATVRNHADYKSDLAGKNRTYLLATAPSGANAGDLWIDTANGNLLKRWNGSSWVAVQDGAISIAQQMANKIAWIIASGDSASNMELTDRLYSLVTNRVMITAQEQINLSVADKATITMLDQAITGIAENISLKADKLAFEAARDNLQAQISAVPGQISMAVSNIKFGGRNLLRNTLYTNGTPEWSIGSNNGLSKIGTHTPDPFGGIAIRFYDIGGLTWAFNDSIKHLPLAKDDEFTLSFWAFGTNNHGGFSIVSGSPVATIGTFGLMTPKKTVGGWSYYEGTCKLSSAGTPGTHHLKFETTYGPHYFCRMMLGEGNKATPYSPAPEDPVEGLKTAGIEIGPGTFNAYASLAFDMLFGSGANEFGMSNHRSDLLALWTGGNPANAKTRLWMDGAARFDQLMLGNSGVNQFTQMYPYADADNADPDNSMVFKVFIPSDCSGVQSLKLSFQLEAFRAYSKSASGGSGTVGGIVNPPKVTGYGDGSIGQHQHVITGHEHYAGAHTHPILYGIYESTAATSCEVIVDGVNIGSFASLTARDITAHLAKTSGKVTRDTWHTIELKPNGLTRIVAQAFLVTVVATATNAIY